MAAEYTASSGVPYTAEAEDMLITLDRGVFFNISRQRWVQVRMPLTFDVHYFMMFFQGIADKRTHFDDSGVIEQNVQTAL